MIGGLCDGGAHLPLLSAAAPPAAPAAAPLPAAAAPLLAAAAAPLAAAAAARIVRVGGRAAVATLAPVAPLVLASGLMGAALVSALLVSEVAHERADLRVHALSRLEERVRPAAARHGLLHEPVALRRALEEPPSPNAIAPAQPLQLARVIVCLRPLSLQRAVERCRRRRRRGASRLSLLRLLEQPASPASLSALALLSHLRPLCRRRGGLAACRGGRGGGGSSCEQGHLGSGHERRQRREGRPSRR